MQTSFSDALEYMSQGKPSLAEDKILSALEHEPEREQYLSLLGRSLLEQKKFREAIITFKKSINSNPLSDSAQIELATSYLMLSEFSKAEEAFKRSLELNPKQSEAWLFLGNLSMKKGERTYAKTCFKNADNNDPFNPDMLQALNFMKEKNYSSAEKMCRGILKKHNAHAPSIYLLADLASKVGAQEESIKILLHGLNHSPYNVKLLHFLAQSYSALSQYDGAINAAKKLVLIEPENAAFWIVLAGELANVGNNEESIKAYQNAVDISPDMATAHLLLGHVLKIAGYRERCEQAYHQPLAIKDIEGAAYWALADLKSYQFTSAEINEMTVYFDSEQPNQSQRSQAGFALAKAHEDNNNYGRAFRYYQLANKLRPGAHFEPAEYQKVCQTLRISFTPENLKRQAKNQDEATPIFIVGLPRSGSTLIEQILASHSQVEGTMELYTLPNLVRRINILGGQRYKSSYPESISMFSVQELTAFGKSYLDDTKIFRQGSPFFIDKLPPNFQQVGLIHKILPQAIIIDARRHPVSCGFSTFKQHFASGHGFSYDLQNIAAYYNNYLDLMDYWEETLPNKILTVQYEEMVQETEIQIRKIVEHCGLEFETECLKFYQNKRSVRTASSEQVRQPIYNKSTQQWRKFEPHLQPLISALGKQTINRFRQWS